MLFGKVKDASNGLMWFLRVLLVFCFCTFAWIFFVAKTLPDAIYVVTHMFYGLSHPVSYLKDGATAIHFTKADRGTVIFALILLFIYDYFSLKRDLLKWITEKSLTVRWFTYIVLILIIAFLSEKGVAAEFVYFQF